MDSTELKTTSSDNFIGKTQTIKLNNIVNIVIDLDNLHPPIQQL